MAYDFDAASTQYLSLGSAPVTAFPCSLAVWVKPNNLTASNCSLAVTQDTTVEYVSLWSSGDVTDDPARAINRGTGGQAIADVTSYTADAWQSQIGVFTDEDNSLCRLAGSEVTATNSPGVDGSSNWDELFVGTVRSTLHYFSGRIGSAAVYNIALSAGDREMLAAGYAPSMVRPDALVFYWDGLSLFDQISGTAMTNNGTALKVSDHPPMIYPSSLFVPSVETPVVLGRQYSGMSSINRCG